jgi:hypothetical protein
MLKPRSVAIPFSRRTLRLASRWNHHLVDLPVPIDALALGDRLELCAELDVRLARFVAGGPFQF